MNNDALKALERIYKGNYSLNSMNGERGEDYKTLKQAISTAQSETGLAKTLPPNVYYSEEGDNFYCAISRKGMGNEFYHAHIHLFRPTPPRTEDATNTVTLSKEGFERVTDALGWIKDPRDEGFPIELDDTRLIAHMVHLAKTALSILEKDIKP